MKNDPKSMTSEPMKKTIVRMPGLILAPRDGGGVAVDGISSPCSPCSTVAIG